MSGGSKTETTQQTVPDWLKPYYTQALGKAQGLLQGPGPQYYPGPYVAPMSSQEQQGLGQIGQVAQGGNLSNNAAQANAFETSGALLNPNANPYLQGMFKQGANQVENSLSSEFGRAGSNVINSTPVQTDALNNLATQLYGGAYNTGLQEMTRAAGLAPTIQAGQYLPGQELMQAGQLPQQLGQEQIQAQQQAYMYGQELPYNQLSWYSGLLGQNASPFGGQRSVGTSGNSPGLSAAGGALSGAATGGMVGGPIGAGIGGVAGGLLGYFGSGG